jgi:hypothetical protein
MNAIPWGRAQRRAALALGLLLAAAPVAALDASAIRLRGLVDVGAQAKRELRWLNTTNLGDTPFDPLRVRLFVEGGSTSTQVYLQFLYSEESYTDMRLYGAYLLHRPLAERELYLEAGKAPVHDGIWAAHTYSDRNPLISVPLAYTWRCTLPSRQLPVDLAQLVAVRGSGQQGVEFREDGELRGTNYASMPMLYDNCWNYGVYALGAEGRVEYVLGLTAGSPSGAIATVDTNEDLAPHAKLGLGVAPGLKLYLSWAGGAYLGRQVADFLPAGRTVNDYQQRLWGLSTDWQWGHLQLLGEVFWNHYETPLRAAGLANQAFYLQGDYTLVPGWQLALRYEEMRFEELAEMAGSTWDQDVRRWEGGLAYHLSRDLVVKLVGQGTDIGAGWDADSYLTAVQLSFAF